MAKISDAASNSSGLVTREPTSETAIGNYSDQDSLEDSGLVEPSIFEGSFCVDQRVAATIAKISDGSSIDLLTREPTSETAISDSSNDESPEEAFYSLAELVDPKIWKCKRDIVERPHEREQFLAPDIFEVVFGMAKDDFTKLPAWKQSSLKKQHQLF
jgi:hypothetical protein